MERIDTHISHIFLASNRALKMKRAVRFPYVDFSTPESRLRSCYKELDLNSITAPGLYLGVRRITREADGKLVLDGSGQLVDAVVEMARFEQSQLLDRMALAGRLTPGLMNELAQVIVQFHQGAPVAHTARGTANIAGVLSINEAGLRREPNLLGRSDYAIQSGVPVCPSRSFGAARQTRASGQGAQVSWRSAFAQHLYARW